MYAWIVSGKRCDIWNTKTMKNLVRSKGKVKENDLITGLCMLKY